MGTGDLPDIAQAVNYRPASIIAQKIFHGIFEYLGLLLVDEVKHDRLP